MSCTARLFRELRRLQCWLHRCRCRFTLDAIPGPGYRSPACTVFRSLFRLCARTSGLSPLDNGVKTNLAIPFHRLPSCRFSRLQGFAIIQSPLPYSFAAEARFPLVLSPFRVLHVCSVGNCYQSPPLLSFILGFSALAGTSAVCSTVSVCSSPSCDGSEPLPSWALRPFREFS